MHSGQVGRYEKRIAEEEMMADEAKSPDLALAHRQVAMLYKSELALMRRSRTAIVGEELAKTA
jgi:hypothetical protein